MSNIPLTIVNVVNEATSEYNDGFTQAAAKRILQDVNKCINDTLTSRLTISHLDTKYQRFLQSQKRKNPVLQ